jgi:alkylhydroperoxidase family enzyme
MRLKIARVPPVDLDQLDEDQREALKVFSGRPLNIFRTLAHAPKALSRFLDWGNYVLSRRNSLPAREREIVILRVGWLCRSGYEFTQHRAIGLREGLSEPEIEAIKQGAGAPNWGDAERALIRATDELHADQFISDDTWAALSRQFDQKQCMDVVFTVGQYTQVSMMLNTFGVQLDEGLTLDPDFEPA